MKLTFLLVIFIIIGGVAAWWWSGRTSGANAPQQSAAFAGPPGAPGGQSPPPMEVTVEKIAAQEVSRTKDLPGRTMPYRIAEIRPQVNGIVTKRLFEEGSDVKAGQQLYQIDPAVYQAAFASAQADLMKAQANAKSTLAKSARYAELVKIGGVSKQEYDDIQASVAQANADIAIAQAALSAAKINLDYTKVFSPIEGRIGKSMVTEGALATQNQTSALATVQQLDPIYVDVTQSSVELLQLRRELAKTSGVASRQPVELFVEGDDRPYAEKGELQFSDVSVDETTGSVQLRILFANPSRELLPGQFVKARLAQSRVEAAVTVPQKATTRSADGSVTVMTVDAQNKAAPRPVTLGQAAGDRWIVTQGLKAGDVVIVEGYQKVKPGDVVKPVVLQAPTQAPAAPVDGIN